VGRKTEQPDARLNYTESRLCIVT